MIAIKKARLRRDGLEYGLPCVWLQDEGGTSTYTLLPDTRPVPPGYKHPIRAHALGISYSIVKTPMFTFTVSWHYISLCIYHALRNLNDELEL
jgi:hypothetical protein